MMMIRIGALLVGLSALFSSGGHAQTWPNRPIQMIVPFAAGGSTDVAARLVAQHLSKALGQQVVVENKTGANGNLGTEMAAKAAPDGYTILVVPESIVGNPHIYKVSYEPLEISCRWFRSRASRSCWPRIQRLVSRRSPSW